MNTLQYILCLVAIFLGMVLVYEWKQVNKAEDGPKKLLIDIRDHAFGGVPRSDLEPWLSRRGGDVQYEAIDAPGRIGGVDHVVWHDVRHMGDAHEDLHGDFYYDKGDYLTYFITRPVWERPKQKHP